MEFLTVCQAIGADSAKLLKALKTQSTAAKEVDNKSTPRPVILATASSLPIHSFSHMTCQCAESIVPARKAAKLHVIGETVSAHRCNATYVIPLPC